VAKDVRPIYWVKSWLNVAKVTAKHMTKEKPSFFLAAEDAHQLGSGGRRCCGKCVVEAFDSLWWRRRRPIDLV
jgi:hypothetical protein